jgi:hypothetical protein
MHELLRYTLHADTCRYTQSLWNALTHANTCPALDKSLHMQKHVLPSMHEIHPKPCLHSKPCFKKKTHEDIRKVPETRQHMPIYAQLLSICGNIWRHQLCTWYTQIRAATNKAFYMDQYVQLQTKPSIWTNTCSYKQSLLYGPIRAATNKAFYMDHSM